MTLRPTRLLVVQGMIAAIYAALTLALEPISYGMLQFRLSEILLVLVLLNRPSWIGLTLGCFIANIFSPLGILDMIFGTLATALTCGGMLLVRRPTVALLLPALINGIVIGLLLHFVYGLPLVMAAAYVGIGEFIVTYIPGLLIYYKLRSSRIIRKIFTGDDASVT